MWVALPLSYNESCYPHAALDKNTSADRDNQTVILPKYESNTRVNCILLVFP